MIRRVLIRVTRRALRRWCLLAALLAASAFETVTSKGIVSPEGPETLLKFTLPAKTSAQPMKANAKTDNLVIFPTFSSWSNVKPIIHNHENRRIQKGTRPHSEWIRLLSFRPMVKRRSVTPRSAISSIIGPASIPYQCPLLAQKQTLGPSQRQGNLAHYDAGG